MNGRAKLLQRYRGRCAYCGAELQATTVTVDHVIPRSKGGIRSKKNTKPSCRFCNMTKSDLSVKEFRNKLMELFKVDTEEGKRVRNKYNLDGGKVVFYYEKLFKVIAKEQNDSKAAWSALL